MHGWCFKYLRKNANKVGLAENFKTLAQNEQLQVFKKYCPSIMGLDDKKISYIRNLISRLKCAPDGKKVLKKSSNPGRLMETWDEYHDFCIKQNYIDFDDMILYGTKVASLMPSYQYLLIDEFQDINPAQVGLCRKMRRDGFLFAVGDDDQSIYSFRGAQNALEKKPGSLINDAKILKLVTNYRSSSNILDFANTVIDANFYRRKKTLVAAGKFKKQETVKFFHFENSQSENKYIAEYINRIVKNPKNPYNYGSFAVISRTMRGLIDLEPQLTLNGIPYDLKGAKSVINRPKIKFFFALLKILIDKKGEDTFSWKTALESTPKVGAKTIESILNRVKEEGISIYHAAQEDKRAVALINTLEFLKYQTAEIQKTQGPSAAFMVILTIISKLINKDPKNMEDEENHKILVNMGKNFITGADFESIEELIEEFSLISAFDPTTDNPLNKNNVVSMLTAHASKGAEFELGLCYTRGGWKLSALRLRQHGGRKTAVFRGVHQG